MKTLYPFFAHFVLPLLLLAVGFGNSYGQSLPPNLNGEGLKDWLRVTYYDDLHNSLGYSDARMYMYNYIDNEDDSVRCVYSGFKVSWAAGGTGTNPAPVNCEHTIPQSLFSSANPMQSDIHHLYPTYDDWNSIRSNHPLVEIDDVSATKWMIRDTEQTSVPSSNIENYSEFMTASFEPREDHKGNLARSIFYFYTMYPAVGDISQVGDSTDFYLWHLLDTADVVEQNRNSAIETYQGNLNPYIEHSDAIEQAFLFFLDPSAPNETVGLSLTSAVEELTLTWNNVANEDGYYIYRAAGNSTFSLLDSIPADSTIYLDSTGTIGTIYSYYIVPYNNNGIGVSSFIEQRLFNGAVSDLLFSEYIEGTSFNKGLEIANFTGASVDLSNYDLRKQTNGSGTWSTAYDLSGSLANNDVLVLTHTSASASMTAVADITSGSPFITFNGNDPVALFKEGVLIDIIGEFDGGTANFAQNVTMVRNEDVYNPNTTYTTSEWIMYDVDEFSYLGSHVISISAFDLLPVEIASFEVHNKNSVNHLNWTTLSETNNDYFQLERSRDAINFQSIGIIDGHGNTNEVLTYNYSDDDPIVGINYYRLKQVDFDSSFSYGKTISVRTNPATSIIQLSVWPNPVQLTLYIDGIDNFDQSNITIQIFDLSGNSMVQQTLTSGSIDTNGLPVGFYIMVISSPDFRETVRFIKQ